MNKRNFLKTLAGAIATVPAMAIAQPTIPNFVIPTVRNRGLRTFPNVPLLTHEGKLVHFYDDLIKDKTVLINFTYATCENLCPGMTANLKLVQKEFGDRVGKDIFMYSISLTPEHDTPAVLKQYVEDHHIKPGWTFLTGKKDDVELLRRKLGFSFSDPAIDNDRSQHLGVVKYGIEPLQIWGTCPALGDPKYIAEYVRWMEPNGSRPGLTEMIG